MKLSQIWDSRKNGTMVRNLRVSGYEKWQPIDAMSLKGHDVTVFLDNPHWEESTPKFPLEVLELLRSAASQILCKVSETDGKYGENLESWVALGNALKEAEASLVSAALDVKEFASGKRSGQFKARESSNDGKLEPYSIDDIKAHIGLYLLDMDSGIKESSRIVASDMEGKFADVDICELSTFKKVKAQYPKAYPQLDARPEYTYPFLEVKNSKKGSEGSVMLLYSSKHNTYSFGQKYFDVLF